MNQREIPREHEISRAAQRAVERDLAPCITTRPAQGDDYGLDGFVQHVQSGIPPVWTGLTFGLQTKGHEAAFVEEHAEPLRVRDLVCWRSQNLPVLIAVHSLSSKATRCRFADEIVLELQQRKPLWEQQDTVAVHFTCEHERLKGGDRGWLHTFLANDADADGGLSRFHKIQRSVLLTEIYHDKVFAGQRFTLALAPNGPPVVGDCWTGMSWAQGELDEHAVHSRRVLAAALLLFEQVYFPAQFIAAAVAAMGIRQFMNLIRSQRLIPLVNSRNEELTFITGSDGLGDLYFLSASGSDLLGRNLRAVATHFRLSGGFERTVRAAIREVSFGKKLELEINEVSKTRGIRDLVGLGESRPQSKEAPWSADRLLRIGNIAKFYHIAEQVRADVVEFEPGLAHVALARWGSRVRFHRVHPAIEELNASFAAASLPDVGLLCGRIGFAKCIAISESKEGVQFREWFWKTASEIAELEGGFAGEVSKRLRSMVGKDCPLPEALLIHAVQDGHLSEILASRPGGAAAVQRQNAFSALRLDEQIRLRHKTIPDPNADCPCLSGCSFRKCCGRLLQARWA